MAGLVPVLHDCACDCPAIVDVDSRNKSGHDAQDRDAPISDVIHGRMARAFASVRAKFTFTRATGSPQRQTQAVLSKVPSA